ncbi:MAG TPA: AAA family ATPase, partial [Candidatus Paceibacterota bacterium]|nr:AAA family ATPase [Candidatus Paceibacterota bacterium]
MGNFLTRLELQGFKSFADKTDFDLSDRIIGIVGPNGSGKSNIIDAIRWILGEREAKKLRGDLLENLIFAGTPKRSPSSLARVTLTFNNSSDILSVDAEEVSISRRIDRSGSSQFFINNREVRLKDLISTLAQARLGSRGLSIIGQGDADVFVTADDFERREMIEEILGLKEYRLKKRTAERRLKKTKVNMEKLEVKLEEMIPHLKFLRRQRNKWEKRSEIEKKLHDISQKYFSHHYYKFTEYIDKVDDKISKLEKQKKEKSKRIRVLDQKLEEENKPVKEEDEVKNIRKKLSRLRSDRLGLEKKMARVEAKIEYEKKVSKSCSESDSKHSVSELLSLIKRFVKQASEVSDAKVFVDKWVKRFNKLFSVSQEKRVDKPEPSQETVNELNDVKSKLGRVNKEIEELENKEDKILSEQDEKNQEFRKKVEELEKKKNERRQVENRINEKEMAKERADFRLRELKNKWESLGYPLEKIKDLPKVEMQGDEDWDKMERKIDRYRSKLSSIGDIDKSLIKEADETEKRYESMKEELEDVREAASDLENLIDDLERKIHDNFKESFSLINKEFNNYFRLMFGGGKAKLKLAYPEVKEDEEDELSE